MLQSGSKAEPRYTYEHEMLLTIGLIAFPLLADSIPSGWIVVKDLKNLCQIGAPGDFKLDNAPLGLAKGPGDKVEVMILSSTGAVKPLNEVVAQALGIDKFIENTDKRQFYSNKPNKIIDGRTVTGWTVKVPRQGGNCTATITVVPGGQ
jgi:hypothetical protein